MQNSINSWIVHLNATSNTRFRLFCFPYAAGSTAIFHSWMRFLPDYVDVCVIRLPGRESRLNEFAFTNLTLLVKELSDIIHLHLNYPFAFFGHSLGALICFELSRELRRRNYPTPVHLFVSAHKAPQLPASHTSLHLLPEIELIKELRRLNGTPETIIQNEELLRVVLPAFRADLALDETYVYKPEPPLTSSISALGGIQDEEVKRESLDAWRIHTSNTFSLHMFTGDHFFLQTNQMSLLQVIARDIIQLSQLTSD